MKLKPFREAPVKKLGVENDRLGPNKFFTRPKNFKSFLKVMDFCKTFLWLPKKLEQRLNVLMGRDYVHMQKGLTQLFLKLNVSSVS